MYRFRVDVDVIIQIVLDLGDSVCASSLPAGFRAVRESLDYGVWFATFSWVTYAEFYQDMG